MNRKKRMAAFSIAVLLFAGQIVVSGSDTSTGLPQRWYAGDYGKKPNVRDQGKYGTCWALSAVSALEAALLPERQMVFSADHLSRNNAFTADVDTGGDYLMAMAYLSGWQGPVLEQDDPYGDEYSPSGLSPAVHVQEIQVLHDPDEDEIKKAVLQYGGVQTSLYMDYSTTAPEIGYYKEESSAYYYNGEEIQNHDVLILGWDDGFSRDLFATTPSRDGAFICLNTWGEEFGEDGIFYVSYDDANLGSTGVIYTRVEMPDNYDHIYQTDDCGWQGSQGYDDEMCWFANVYTAEGDESLEAVGFYATAPDALYELYFAGNFDGVRSFENRRFLQSGSMEEEGYYTVDLEEPIRLSEGERFAVIVKMTTPGVWNPVAVEYQADEYTQNVTLDGKNGYLSQNGSYWQQTEKEFGTNVCLKAYTKEVPSDKLRSSCSIMSE